MILYFFSAPSLPGLCVSVYTLSIYSLLFLLFTLRREEFVWSSGTGQQNYSLLFTHSRLSSKTKRLYIERRSR